MKKERSSSLHHTPSGAAILVPSADFDIKNDIIKLLDLKPHPEGGYYRIIERLV